MVQLSNESAVVRKGSLLSLSGLIRLCLVLGCVPAVVAGAVVAVVVMPVAWLLTQRPRHLPRLMPPPPRGPGSPLLGVAAMHRQHLSRGF